MKTRILSILCCLALLVGCVGGLGVVAETTAEQQACVTGATLTGFDNFFDSPLLPTGKNLLAGLGKLSDSSAASSGNLSALYDGLYQGINQDVTYQKNEDGSWKVNAYNQVVTDVTDTRYVSYVTDATADAMGYAQIGFDLGSGKKLNRIVVGGTAEPANASASHPQFADPTFDGIEMDFTKDTRLHMIDIYVSKTATTLYDEANKVVSADFLNGDISAYKSSLAPLAALFTLDKAAVGRYVGFRLYVAGVNGSGALNTTINGKTANWGWYSQVRLSELGVFGQDADLEADAAYTRVPVTAITDLPEENLIAGLTPTLPDGKKPNVQSGGNLANITDGLIQGVNQEVGFVLTQDEKDITTVKNGHTYYSYVAPDSLVKSQGKDPDQTWYLKPANTHWLASDTDSQRAVLYGGSSGGGDLVYDLGQEAAIDSLLIASSVELNGTSNYTYYDGDYDSSKHPVLAESALEGAMKPIADNRLLYKGKVYVSNDRNTLFSPENVVLDFDLSFDYERAWRNLWKLPETATGRYVGFGLNDTTMSATNTLVRISELGVYGERIEFVPWEATTYNYAAMKNNMTPRADNLLVKAVDANYRQRADGSVTADGKLRTALVDGTFSNDGAAKLCPGGNGVDYYFFTYDLGKVYSLDSATFVGDGYDGANGVAVYVTNEDWPEAYAGGAVPDAYYDSGVGTTERVTNNKTDAVGVRFTFHAPVLGRYVTFRLEACRNVNSMQVWVSEFAATGKDGTVLPLDSETVAGRIPSAENNALAGATTAYYRAGNDLFNSDHAALLTTLVDGALSTLDAAVLKGDDYVYVCYDMGAAYDFTSLVYAGDGIKGAGSVALWVGDRNLAAIISKGIEPTAIYNQSVGADVVAVNFNLTVSGRYVTFRLATVDGQVTISQFAAVGAPSPIKESNQQTIVCVGDSITYGTVFTTPDTTSWNTIRLANNYPAQLEAMLNGLNDGVYYNVVNAGISASAVIGVDQTIPGTNTTFPNSGNGTPTTWLEEQDGSGFVQAADKVLIMLGTNDAHNSNGAWSARAPYYKEYYKKIIDAYRAKNPEVEIYVVTSPYTTASTHNSNLANSLVPLQKKMAADWGLPVIDVYEASKHHVEVLNGGDLSSFIDSNDIAKGLSVHPHEAGQTVIAQTCFDALTGDQNDLYVIGFEGAQIRNYTGDVPTGDLALRFGMSLSATGISMSPGYTAILSADSRVTIGGKDYTVTGMGTVVAVKDKLDIPYEGLVAGIKDDWAKDVKARRLYSADDNGVTYTAVVTGIDEANYDTTLVARGYVQYQDGDEVGYAYGPLVTRTASEVVAAHTMAEFNPTYDMWKGFRRMTFYAGGVECYLVLPDEFAEGNPWLWRTEFFGVGDLTDIEMLEAGWALGYCRVSNMYGSPWAVSIMKRFYDAVVPMANLRRQAVLLGVSRGGLYAVNYAATYPTTVAGIYLNCPVQDICSWPAYLYNNPAYDQATVNEFKYLWDSCRSQYGFSSDAQALADRSASPRWKYNILLENDIPVLLAYGEKDKVVFFSENGQLLVDAYNGANKSNLLHVEYFPEQGHCVDWPKGASAYILENMK